jgi:hypothetical protein
MMRSNRAMMKRLSLAILVLLVAVGIALASTGLDLGWSTVDGGGQTSSSGDYSLVGTIGQPDAGLLVGGGYELGGGFWGGGVVSGPQYELYLPQLLRH